MHNFSKLSWDMQKFFTHFSETSWKAQKLSHHELVYPGRIQNLREFLLPFRSSHPDVFLKRCSENMQKIYRRTPIPKCDFNEVLCNFIEITLWHGCSPVNLRRSFLRNTSGWLLLTLLLKRFWDGWWDNLANYFLFIKKLRKVCSDT